MGVDPHIACRMKSVCRISLDRIHPYTPYEGPCLANQNSRKFGYLAGREAIPLVIVINSKGNERQV